MRVTIPDGEDIIIKIKQYGNKVVKCTIYDYNLVDSKITGISKCHPDDVFDFDEGATLATTRALFKRKIKYRKLTKSILEQLDIVEADGDTIISNAVKRKLISKRGK